MDATPGTLYLVGTPIGNLEDITLRAVRVLREVGLIAAEDTRVTRVLLQRYEIHTRLISYHEHSGPGRLQEILEALRRRESVAFVSDAGMPGVSDPGAKLVKACADAAIPVSVVARADGRVRSAGAIGLADEGAPVPGFSAKPRGAEAGGPPPSEGAGRRAGPVRGATPGAREPGGYAGGAGR